MTRKTTKRALGLSFVSLLLCITMLMGTTFAWFTDEASVTVNKIESGTLDIQLLASNQTTSLEGKTLKFKKADGTPADEKVLFEPGAKYELDQVYLYNAGNLNAKYQVVITGIDGSSLLAKVLDVYVGGTKTGKTLYELVASGGVINASVIKPNDYYTFGTIALEMQTSADNEYQGLTMDGISITVQATQATVEYDSYNNTYDAGAEFDKIATVHNQDELNKAIANANEATVLVLSEGTYTLPQIGSAQGPAPKEITIKGTKETVIDMSKAVQTANCTLTFDGVTVDYADTANYVGFQHAAKVVYENCTITGQMTNYAPEVIFNNCIFENKNNAYCIWTYGGQNVNFSNCTFNTGGKAVLVYTESNTNATIGFGNCTFNDDGSVDTKKGAVEIGCNDGVKAGTYYTIYMNGCTVNGFAVNDEGTTSTSVYWGNKNDMDKDHLNVVIDGVDVY